MQMKRAVVTRSLPAVTVSPSVPLPAIGSSAATARARRAALSGMLTGKSRVSTMQFVITADAAMVKLVDTLA